MLPTSQAERPKLVVGLGHMGNVENADKYKLEYAEVGNLRRHYSVVRSTLTTFSMTASLTAFGSYFTQQHRLGFLAFIGWFMLIAALVVCLYFSYRCEVGNLYARIVWKWFGGQIQGDPPHFYDFRPGFRDVVKEMLGDLMNWIMIVSVALILIVFYKCCP